MQPERRQHPRHASHWPLTVTGRDADGRPFEIRALMRDVSGGGICLATPVGAPLQRGQHVELQVEGLDGESRRLGRGMVMWLDGGVSNAMIHAGVMMEDLHCMQRLLPALLNGAETASAA